MAGKPRRYKLAKESLSGEGPGLGGEVHGVREGAGEYESREGTPRKREDSTRPSDSTRCFETAQGIKSYSEVAEILAVSAVKTQALAQGVREALLKHKQAGNAIVIWRDGKMVWINPEEISPSKT